MTLPEAIDAPRIHMQGQPDAVFVEPFGVSPDTAAILTQDGYKLVPSTPWGMAAGIIAGAPGLAASDAAGHALSLAGAGPRHALFGAEDVRSPTGSAEGF